MKDEDIRVTLILMILMMKHNTIDKDSKVKQVLKFLSIKDRRPCHKCTKTSIGIFNSIGFTRQRAYLNHY